MSSNSEQPKTPPPKTYEQLLSLRSDLVRLRELHRSSLWDSLLVLLQAARLFHLNELAETDDEKESLEHKIIARWIKNFTEIIPFEVESAYQAEEAKARGPVEEFDPTEGGTAFMESDGDTPELSN